jgi:hypothetical protein
MTSDLEPPYRETVDRLGPGEREAEAIRVRLQENLYDMLRHRRSIWFG